MPKAIKTPLVKKFKLLKFDDSGETTVTIRQATQREHALRSEMFAEVVREWDDSDTKSTVRVRQRISMAELQAKEIYLTMCACDILQAPISDEAAEAPLFKFNMGLNGRMYLADEGQFTVALGLLPMEVVTEIHGYVREVNPQWGNQGEA